MYNFTVKTLAHYLSGQIDWKRRDLILAIWAKAGGNLDKAKRIIRETAMRMEAAMDELAEFGKPPPSIRTRLDDIQVKPFKPVNDNQREADFSTPTPRTAQR